MPEIIQTIMLAAPNTHFIMLSQAILFRGAHFDVVWPQFMALVFCHRHLHPVLPESFQAVRLHLIGIEMLESEH